jgi:hypothetical protein
MAANERVQGLASVYALIDKLPEAARKELGSELPAIGQDILAAQRADVAKQTGALSAGLSVQYLVDQLRLRVGLIDLKGSRAKLYYGRFVEYGRKAQVVLARRRRVGGRVVARALAASYTMRVTALAPRPFVQVVRPDLDTKIANRLANFWSSSIDRAAAGAGA